MSSTPPNRLFREVIRLRPKSDVGYNNLAAVHLMSGEMEQAEPLLQAAIGIDPDGPAYNNLGVVYYSMGRFTDALEQFRKAIEISGLEDPHYLTGLAHTSRQLDLDAAAKEYYTRADELWRQQLEVNPNDNRARRSCRQGSRVSNVVTRPSTKHHERRRQTPISPKSTSSLRSRIRSAATVKRPSTTWNAPSGARDLQRRERSGLEAVFE